MTKNRYINVEYKSGDKYNAVVLTGKSYIKGTGTRMIEFICDCGNLKWVPFSKIITGVTKSCGCLSRQALVNRRVTHGLCRHKLYKLWSDMIQRCTNPKNTYYHNYGGRGIAVCQEWKENASTFIFWAESNGWEYGKNLTLERGDNDGNYEPKNCTWQTRYVQSRNRRSNLFLTAFGETKCLVDWGNDSRCVVAYNTISRRILKFGWDAEKAILTPPFKVNS